MEEKKSLDMFSFMPVSKAVIKNAIPAMAAMLMVLIYNLADTFFVGQTGDALQVAAVSLATPVFLLFTALGSMFGIGGTSVISRAMGAGRREYAHKVSAFCMWGCVAVVALLLIFMDNILVLIGASAETWDLARNYLTIVAFCGPFVLIGNCYSNILRAEGQETKAMMGMLIGNLLNVILDPIMILGFGWNITSAAIATVIGNIVGALYYVVYFLRGKSTLSISIKDFSVKDKICSGVLVIGIPAVTRLGYWERFKHILKFSLLFALAVGIILTGIYYLFTNQIVRAFLTEENAFEYGVQFVRILLSTCALFGVFYVLTKEFFHLYCSDLCEDDLAKKSYGHFFGALNRTYPLKYRPVEYVDYHITRLDIAIDDRNEEPFFEPLQLYKKTLKGEFVSGSRSLNYRASGQAECDQGETLYIGDGSSNLSYRIYDKGEEQAKKRNKPIEEMGGWIRTELQLRREKAHAFTQLMAKEPYALGRQVFDLLGSNLRFVTPNPKQRNKSRWSTYRFWTRFLGAIEPLTITIAKVDSTLLETQRWLKNGGMLSAVKAFLFLEQHGALGGLEDIDSLMKELRFSQSLGSKVSSHLVSIGRMGLIPLLKVFTAAG